MKKILFAFLICSLIFSSCGQINKGVAKNQILGTYNGTVNIVVKYSLLNLGLADQTKEYKGPIYILKDSKENVFLRTGDGDLKISGLTLAANGATFSIPNQKISSQDGINGEIEGFQVAYLDGVKYDGMYDSQSNKLIFGYVAITNYNYSGQNIDLSMICVYEFSKVQ